jgi:hemoglobin
VDFSFAGEVTIDRLYDVIGEQGIAGLTANFYRQIPHNTTLAPMYPRQEFEASEMRLREFLVFRFGGPRRYIEQRGHPRLRMRHAPFPIDQAARNEWVALMDRALDEMAFSPQVTNVLRAFFHEVATFLVNQDTAGNA